MTRAPQARMTLCPFWARFHMRPDGRWLAYCSAEACEQLEESRPGWREHGEMPRAEHCQLGWPDEMAVVSPSIMTPWNQLAGVWESAPSFARFRLHTLQVAGVVDIARELPPHKMTDDLWAKCCEALDTFSEDA